LASAPVPPVHGKVGRPRSRPKLVTADRAYDFAVHRRQLHQRGIKAEIARRKTEHGSGLGRHRWVVERTFAWLRLPHLLPPAEEQLIVKRALNPFPLARLRRRLALT
jgi:transposase